MIPAQFAALKNPRVVTFFASATSTVQTITMPSSILSGDVAFLFDAAENSTSALPAQVTPSGWTVINTGTALLGGVIGIRGSANYKVLAGSEGGSSITGMNGASTNSKIIAVFRKSFGTWGSPSSVNFQVVNGSPSGQLVTVGSAPLIVVAWNWQPVSNAILTMSPAADATIDEGTEAHAGYKIYNGSPSNNNVSTNTSSGAFASFYIAAS